MGIVAGNAILSNGAGEHPTGAPDLLEVLTEGWFSLSCPTLVSPLNDATGVDSPIVFEWDFSGSSPSAHIQISKNSDFSTIDYEQIDILTESISLNLTSYNTKYYWRVRIFDFDLTTPWSDIWSFTTNSKYGTSLNNDMPIIYFRGRK